MRFFNSLIAGIIAALVGGITFFGVRNETVTVIDQNLPSYIALHRFCPLDLSPEERFEWARKYVRVYLTLGCILAGAAVNGLSVSWIFWLQLGGVMTVIRAYLLILGSAILGACLGGGVGYLLGITAPGYYRSVFRSGGEPWFDPVQVGLGLGISQGLFAGMLMGGVVVMVVTWYQARTLKAKPQGANQQPVPPTT